MPTRRARLVLALLALLTAVAAALVATGPPASAKPRPKRPTVTKVAPTAGTIAGGTRVTVTGTNLSKATKVTFGGVKGTGIKVVSATKLTVVSPTHAAGKVDVQVTTAGGTSTRNAKDSFTFAQLPTAVPVPLPTGLGAATATSLRSVDCVQGVCTAIGMSWSGGKRRGLAVRGTPGGTWTSVTTPTAGAPDDRDPNVELDDLSCPTTTFCAAVGNFRDASNTVRPLLLTFDGSTWTAADPGYPTGGQPEDDRPLNAIACPAAGACVAVGEYQDGATSGVLPFVATLAGGTWTSSTTAVPAGSGFHLLDVACGAVGSCSAVGDFNSDETGYVTGLMGTLSGGAWSMAAAPLPANAAPGEARLAVVDCAASSCAAGGTYLAGNGDSTRRLGLLLAASGGTWSAQQAPLPSGAYAAEPYASITALDCVAPQECVASGPVTMAEGGYSAAVLSRTASASWTAREATFPHAVVNPQATSYAAVCAAPGACGVGVNYIPTNANGDLAMNVQGSGAAWVGYTLPLPAGANTTAERYLFSLDADTASATSTSAVGVGRYVASANGALRALLEIYLPL